jgi:hypothetical protein
VIARFGHATRGAAVARTASLVTLGALAVHQLRYELAFGDRAGHVLAADGHTYLAGILPPLVAVSVATALAATLVRALGGRDSRTVALWHRAALYAGALLAVFISQELIEGVLAAGHPAGVAGVLGAGGWLAIPIALLMGFAAALVSRVLEGAEERIHTTARALRAVRAPRSATTPAIPLPRAPLASLTLAFGLARRPPPAAPIR